MRRGCAAEKAARLRRAVGGVLRRRDGDTLVEILVAFALLLLFLGLAGGNLAYAGRLLRRGEDARRAACQTGEALHPIDGEEDTVVWQPIVMQSYDFFPTGAGGGAAFSLPLGRRAGMGVLPDGSTFSVSLFVREEAPDAPDAS